MKPSPLKNAHRRVLQRIHESHGPRAGSERPGSASGTSQVGATDPEMVPWGATEDAVEPACLLVADYGELEAEYAAIRRGTAIFDRLDRGLIEMRGPDAADLISRLLTNAVPVEGGSVRGFLLARNGRILSDLQVVVEDDLVLLDLDRTDVAKLIEHLESFVFAEDVQITDVTESRQRIELHGPDVFKTFTAAFPDNPPRHWSLEVADRTPCGVPGIAVDVDVKDADEVWEKLNLTIASGARPPRAIGWHAYNIARIEYGSPMFHIDYGPDALPQETGLLDERVSFTKGCYPGQEVVARMHSRGKSKRMLVGFRLQGPDLPIAGSQVFECDENDATGIGQQVGVVTSSTYAPMLGAAPVAFISARTPRTVSGTVLRVVADGKVVDGIAAGLHFMDPEPSDKESS